MRFGQFLSKGLLAGALAVALILPGVGFAQGYPSSSSSTTTTNTTVQSTTNPDGSITTVNPDGSTTTTYPNGTSTTSNTTTTTTQTQNIYSYPSVQVLGYRTAPVDLYSMYNGYDSMYNLENGTIVGYDAYGNPIKADFLKNGGNRVMVRLNEDDNLGPQLDTERGFERGMADFPISNFNPQLLDISTGTTVTFFAESGHHSLEPLDVSGLDQSVPLVPGQIFNFTFNHPGHYRMVDGFGGLPTYNGGVQGLLIRVRGDDLGENGTLPPTASVYFQQLGLYPAAVGSSSGETTSTSTTQESTTTNTVVQPAQEQTTTNTETTTVTPTPAPTQQVQPAQPPAPIIRDHDMK
jgi:plastocyanin